MMTKFTEFFYTYSAIFRRLWLLRRLGAGAFRGGAFRGGR
jgi:hypothetical protein